MKLVLFCLVALLALQANAGAQQMYSKEQISHYGYGFSMHESVSLQRFDMLKLHNRLLDLGVNIVRVDVGKHRILVYTLEPISEETAEKAGFVIVKFFSSRPESPLSPWIITPKKAKKSSF